MTSINGSLRIVETQSQINKALLSALLPQVETYFKKSFDKVSSQIQTLIIDSIKSAPEYEALVSGRLKAEFGLPDSDSRVSNILEFWNNIQVKYEPVKIRNNTKLSGNFTISMIKSDYSDVISLGASTFVTEKGSELNWLEWLLLFGNKTIIKDYEVELGPNPRSRTGLAIMRGVISGKWSVPSEFAGTMNNNWITRSIDSIDSQINKLLLDSLRI